MRTRWTVLALAAAVAVGSTSCLWAAKPDAKMIERIRAALPDGPIVKPAKPRRLLIFNLCKGFRHGSIPVCDKAFHLLGEKTGAYTAVSSTDPEVFRPESLKTFDAVCFNNTTGALFNDPALKKSLMDWVRAGHGVVGVHAATDVGAWKWPEFHQMMGGVFSGHPWHEVVGIKIDDPTHPIARVLGGQGFMVKDEIYQFNKGIYSRERLRVLLSLDMNCTRPKGKRPDNDYAVSWVQSWGKGRIFYCSLGHRDEIFWNPKVLKFYLAGIQFALGDLKADTTPSARLRPAPKPALVPASARKQAAAPALEPVRVLTLAAPRAEDEGWIVLFGGSKADLEKHWGNGAGGPPPANWVIQDGALVTSGKGGYLWTKEKFGDFCLQLEFKTWGNSGVFFRTGNPRQCVQTGLEMQVLNSGGKPNPGKHDCGALYDALAPSSNPVKNGEWNKVVITCRGPRVQIAINGVRIIDANLDRWDTPGKNPDGTKNKYRKALKDFPREGYIGLQTHGAKVAYRNIRIKPLKG